MTWVPLLSTMFGAAIALGGTVLADRLRRTGEHERDSLAGRRHAYLDFVLALGAGVQGLREVAASALTGPDRVAAANVALTDARLYPTRERLLMQAPPAVAQLAERTFEALVGVRDVVRAGAVSRSDQYHDAYHPYAEKMWLFRQAIRKDVGVTPLTPADVSRVGWDDRANCTYCRTRVA